MLKVKVKRDGEECFNQKCNGAVVATVKDRESYGAVVGEINYFEVLGLVKTMMAIVENLIEEYPDIMEDIKSTELEAME